MTDPQTHHTSYPPGCSPGEPPQPPSGGSAVRIPRRPDQDDDGGQRPQQKPDRWSKRMDCCDQILGILKNMPNVDPNLLHKPKVPNRTKVDRLCASLPTQDAIVPILFHILERFLANKTPGNQAETEIFEHLRTVPAKGMQALKSSLAAYKALPANKRRCLFREEYVELPLERPISPELIAQEWLSEGLSFAAAALKPRSGGATGPGKVRPWDIKVTGPVGGREFGTITRTAPWPWICRVGTSEDRDVWYRNNDYKPTLDKIEPHEFARQCTYAPSGGGVVANCPITKPTIRPGDFIGLCDGGAPYTRSNACLKVPDAVPGQAIRLSGFNFFSEKCRVRLTKLQDTSEDTSIVYPDIPVLTWPDREIPLTDADEKVIADCRVQDEIEFDLPAKHPDRVTAFVPGKYQLEVIVPNEDKHPITNDAGQPIIQWLEFHSNPVLLNIQPDPNIEYQIINDLGHCYEETDGPGGDEIWFNVAVATFEPGSKTEIPLTSTKEMPRGPWSDMDSEEDTDGDYIFELYRGKAPAAAISLIGFEVDSETAAQEQLDPWSKAFTHYIDKVWAVVVGSGAVGVVGAALKGASITATLIVAAVAIIVVVVIGIIWAAWAPADLIAADLLVPTAGLLFSLTDAKEPLGPMSESSQQNIGIAVRPFGKVPPDPAAAFARYTEDRQYRCEDEDSTYGLRVHYDRLS